MAVVGKVGGDLKLGPVARETTVKSTDQFALSHRIFRHPRPRRQRGREPRRAGPRFDTTQRTDRTGRWTAHRKRGGTTQAQCRFVLSACNTAAGNKPGAEALSGLARAFFYAGARALLVSHWQVDSDATVRLTTFTFEALQKDDHHDEALRRAMLAM